MNPAFATPPRPQHRKWVRLLGYGSLLLVPVLLFLWIHASGAGLSAPPPLPQQEQFGAIGGAHKFDGMMVLLRALLVIILVARLAGFLFKRLGQPPVIGEVVAGIALGPSLLGQIWPSGLAALLPASAVPLLGVVGQIGIILYMFLVGIELNPATLRKSPHTVLTISYASIAVPFVCGAALALLLYPLFSTSDVPFFVFALFMGLSMSVTAFPVLARILTDLNMLHSRLGSVALTCAAVNDVAAWCMLAMIVSIAKTSMNDALQTLLQCLAFVAFLLWAPRRLVGTFVRQQEQAHDLNPGAMGLVAVALLLCALAAEWIGIHALFGAFLLGTLVPHDSVFARNITRRLHDVAVVFFAPAYFALTGMRTQIDLISSAEQWLIFGGIVAVAVFAKLGSTTVAARLTGSSWRDSVTLGTLMNTRGLMEIVVLNIGLEMKVISPTLFAMLVLMAILTTMLTAPLLALLHRRTTLQANND